MKPVEITVTCASAAEADSIMQSLVAKRLAASGQTWPIKSCYRWDGEVVTDDEHVLLLKTIDAHFNEICDIIRSVHSYELPSIVMIPIIDAGRGYMDWLLASTSTDSNKVGTIKVAAEG